MRDPGLTTYIDKWLSAHPAQQSSLIFMPEHKRDAYCALAALELELVNAAFGLSEASVSATKLKWWAEELAGASASGGRHPITKTLYQADAFTHIEPGLWLAPISAAINQLEDGTPADFTQQWQHTKAVFQGIAKLETSLWFGTDVDAERAVTIATASHLLYTTTRIIELLDGERLPLPMATLAQHGISRNELAKDSPERRAAVATQIEHLWQKWQPAMHQKKPLSSVRGLDARLGQYWLNKAKHHKKPLQRLRDLQEKQTGLRTFRCAWQAARKCRFQQIERS